MADDVDEEIKQDQTEKTAAEAVASPVIAGEPEETAAEETAEEPVELEFGEGLMDAENGKLLGKFNDIPALARSYKELESYSGRTSAQSADYKKALEAQGYTFDADGKPVAPAAPIAEPAFMQEPANQQMPSQQVPDQQAPGSVPLDYLGMPVVPDSEWQELAEEDPEEYNRLRNQYDTLRIIRQENFNVEQGQRQNQALIQTKQNVRTLAKERYYLDDTAITEIEAEVQQVLANVHPSVRNSPQAYEMAARAIAADKMPAIYQRQLQEIMAGNKDAIAKAQRVVAMEKGSISAPASVPAPGYGLSDAEKQMAKDFGVTEKDYAANK